ncbi:MAG: MazG-like family protein [Aeromonadaceae bacterium]
MGRFNDIRQWARDRNLIDGSDRFRQMVKLVEEQGELAAGIAKGNAELVADSIGDMVVVLTILAEQSGLSIEGCIEQAYHEIKDRKGRMIDGVFVKSEDL